MPMPLPAHLILPIFLVVCALLLRLGACADSEDSSSGSSSSSINSAAGAIDKFKMHGRTIRTNSTGTRKRRRSGKNDPSLIADDAWQQRQQVPNCTYVPPSRMRRRLRFLNVRSRRQRLFSRRAYRMAVLAKLAYYDFQREFDADSKNWSVVQEEYSFALVDDPQPPPLLLSSMELKLSARRANQTLETEIASRRMIMGGSLVIRLQLFLCRARHSFVKWRKSIARTIMDTRNRKEMMEARTQSSRTNTTNSAFNGNTAGFNQTRPQNNDTIKNRCRRSLFDEYEAGRRYHVEWALQNWHEASMPKVKWHDTDLIIARSGDSEIVLSFAGTASAADQFTNIQTFEPVGHSGIFGNAPNTTLSGAIHRGFLNAYSRVIRGKIFRLCDVPSPLMRANHRRGNMCKEEITRSLHKRYDDCLEQQQQQNITEEKQYSGGSERKASAATRDGVEASIDNALMPDEMNATKRNKWSTLLKRKLAARIESKRARKRARQLQGCQSQGEKLMDILREIVLEALQSDRSVHLTGHSQGAAIASLLALDIAINFHEVSISKLFLWTFGGPEVADSEFYASARQQSPRLDDFLNDRERYNRFVTRASNCGEDFVTNVASNSLNKRINRRLGGVRGNVVHAAEPVHVPLMSKKSGLEGHFISSYLLGISIASPDQTLEASFSNNNMRVWMDGES